MNGGDHKWPQENLPQVLALANEALEDTTLVQGTLPECSAGIVGNAPLSEVRGLSLSRKSHGGIKNTPVAPCHLATKSYRARIAI